MTSVNLELGHLVSVVIGGVILQGVMLAVAFVSFRAESRAQAKNMRESIDTLKRALGMDGSAAAAFVRRDEFASEQERTREAFEGIHETLGEHGKAIDDLRRAGAGGR